MTAEAAAALSSIAVGDTIASTPAAIRRALTASSSKPRPRALNKMRRAFPDYSAQATQSPGGGADAFSRVSSGATFQESILGESGWRLVVLFWNLLKLYINTYSGDTASNEFRRSIQHHVRLQPHG